MRDNIRAEATNLRTIAFALSCICRATNRSPVCKMHHVHPTSKPPKCQWQLPELWTSARAKVSLYVPQLLCQPQAHTPQSHLLPLPEARSSPETANPCVAGLRPALGHAGHWGNWDGLEPDCVTENCQGSMLNQTASTHALGRRLDGGALGEAFKNCRSDLRLEWALALDTCPESLGEQKQKGEQHAAKLMNAPSRCVLEAFLSLSQG